MQDDIEVVVDGRHVGLRNVGDDMWADHLIVYHASIIVRRTGTLYQADYHYGSAAWFDTPQAAVDGAKRDAENRTGRSIDQQLEMFNRMKEAAE